MSQEKSLLYLYKLLWEQIKDELWLDCGLCIHARFIHGLTEEEISIIQKDIISKMPVRKVKDQYGNIYTSAFGWDDDEEGTQQRKEFVQRMIKELEDGK